jgi:hypothetical protein
MAAAFAERKVEKKYMAVVNNNSELLQQPPEQHEENHEQQIRTAKAQLHRRKHILLQAGNCSHYIQKTVDAKVSVIDPDAADDPNSGIQLLPSTTKLVTDIRGGYNAQRRTRRQSSDGDGADDVEDESSKKATQVFSVFGQRMAMMPARLNYYLIASVKKQSSTTATGAPGRKAGDAARG